MNFFNYYRKLFPSDSVFQTFIQALKTSSFPILRFKPENKAAIFELWKKNNLPFQTLKWHRYALAWPHGIESGTELPGYKEKLFYPMNASSLIPVLALDAAPGDFVLDACAAPGGKALFISELLGHNGKLIANDISAARRNRMKKIFEEYGVANATITGFKAETIFKLVEIGEMDEPDRILLDAPCSSEKHVISSPEHLKKWSPGRIRNLKHRQFALLSGLFLALKPGGRIVYSTCAITPEENEEVVGKFLKKKKDQARLLEWKLDVPGAAGMPGAYACDFNVQDVRRIRPDPQENLDPMFVAVFEKNG